MQIVFSPSILIEYGLNTNSIPVAAVPQVTSDVFLTIFAPLTQLQQPYNGTELLMLSSSQHITRMVPVEIGRAHV